MWLVNCCNTQCKSCFSRGFPLSPKETIRPSSKMMMKVYLLCPALTNVAVSPLFITALISNEWDISTLWHVIASPQDISDSPLICHHPANPPSWTNSEIFAVSVLIICFHFRGTYSQTRGLGCYRGPQQAHHGGRGGALRRGEGQGLHGKWEVVPLQQICGSTGRWLSRGSHLSA